MRNFNESTIVGGMVNSLPPILGSKFDNFNDLIDKYYALLFFTLVKSGITYSTEINAILAQVKIQENGFVNYVQPCIGKWDYTDKKYQRLVSPEFVLYIFNNLCMSESLYRINELAEPIQLSETKQLYPIGIDLSEFSVSNIITLHEKYANEYFKYQNGEPNDYMNIPSEKIAFVNLAYSLIERVTKFSKEYVEYQMLVIKASELRQDLAQDKISYDELSEEQQNLIDDECYNEEYIAEYCPNHYLSLGCFNNFVRKEVLKQLYKQQEKIKKLNETSKGNNPALMEGYNDPIIVVEDYDGEDEYEAHIDYKNAKEFEYGNDLKLERVNHSK